MAYYVEDEVQGTLTFSVLRAGQESTSTKSFSPLNMPDKDVWYNSASGFGSDSYINVYITSLMDNFFGKAFALTTSQVREMHLVSKEPVLLDTGGD